MDEQELINDPDKINLTKNRQVDESLGSPPHSILTFGPTIILFLVLLLFILSWVIKYPDAITGSVTITTLQPPVKVVNPVPGKIMHIYVQENQQVIKGTPLLQIESSLDTSTVHYLQKMIPMFEAAISPAENNFSLSLDTSLLMGEMQPQYNTFVKSYEELKNLYRATYYGNKIIALKNSTVNYQQLLVIAKNEETILLQELKNEEYRYNSQKTLYEKKAVTKFEFMDAENRYLAKQKECANIKKLMIDYQMKINDNNKQQTELQYEQSDRETKLWTEMRNSLNEMKNFIQNWTRQYQLVAPIDGTVIFNKTIIKDQHVNGVTELMTIIPDNTEYIAKVQLPPNGLGKIEKGQQVRINLFDYPEREYGQIRGKVESVSILPKDSLYEIIVTLPHGLETTYHKIITYKPSLSGHAKVITNNKSIALRLFQQLYQFQ